FSCFQQKPLFSRILLIELFSAEILLIELFFRIFTSFFVIGVVEGISFPCEQLVLMTCGDQQVYAYDEEELHLVASSMMQLHDEGMEYPGSTVYYRGEAFKDMVRIVILDPLRVPPLYACRDPYSRETCKTVPKPLYFSFIYVLHSIPTL
uniref:Uncharacterized protein n=1 Tax=Pundamilia nyererei TaxID=303518 RepID=A0A3B4FZB5_9CICH